MTWRKRLFDLALAAILGLVLAPVLAVLLLALLLTSGRPLFYASERMHSPDRPFRLWKLRTMTVSAADSGVSGGDKAHRITPMGRFLRRSRLDEIPQLWNVLRGEMSFVGPRPPLRQYVELRPELYRRVLAARPGITGLATLRFHRREERLLAACRDAAETDRVYVARCIPRKAELDLIYLRRQSVCLDVAILWETLRRAAGARPAGRIGR
jgi:lipopolysaccharide/colanic/teichoic acid biosynthesis glycosyltransferase